MRTKNKHGKETRAVRKKKIKDKRQRWCKRMAIERIMKVIPLLLDNKFPNCTSLGKKFGVSRRTILRDIEFMQDNMELPVEYDPRNFGYHFTRPVDRLPGVDVSDDELFALYVVSQQIETYRGTRHGERLDSGFRKILGRLSKHEQVMLEYMPEEVSFRINAPEEVDAEMFDRLRMAIRKRTSVEVNYQRPGQDPAVRTIDPYHLKNVDWTWCLFARCHREDKVKKYVLSRVLDMTELPEKFVMPEDFDADEHLEGTIGLMTGEGDYHVWMEANRFLTDYLGKRKLHKTHTTQKLPGGRSWIRMRLDNLVEIQQWALGWRKHVKVLGPPEFIAEMTNTVHELAEMYPKAAG